MSIRYLKNDINTLLLELKTLNDRGKLDSLNYKELVKLQGYLHKANGILDSVGTYIQFKRGA